MQYKYYRSNYGWILIFVLIIISVCIGAVLSIEEWISTNSDWTEKFYEKNQANIYISSAITAIKEIFEKDDNSYDSADDLWANIPPIPIEGGTISINVIPSNSKINLNMMLSSDPAIRERTIQAVKNILIQNDYSEETIENMLNWIDPERNYDDFFYREQIPYYKPRKQPFYSLKEVDFVKGLRNFSNKFSNFFTVDGEDEKININFANEEVFKYYLPEVSNSIDEILEYRSKNSFTNITQIKNVAHLSDEDYIAIQRFLTTVSNIFIVKIEVNLKNYTYYATAVIKRNKNEIKVIKYFEGPGNYD